MSAPPPATRPSTGSSFDGQKAFEHVRRLVEIGPRPAGSPGAARARAYFGEQLRSWSLGVREEPFRAETPVGSLEMANVVGELPGEIPDVIILASHYDTKRLDGFVGANDGGSSSGVVLEIARGLASAPATRRAIRHTLWFVFFDGEEAVAHWTDQDSLYGSRHMVERLRANGQLPRVKAMVLLDMVGDRNLSIPREQNSTPWLADLVLGAAARLGHAAHFPASGHGIIDDHMPFLRAGVPAVDLIDLSYGTDWLRPGPGGPSNAWWHTTDDTLDKLSPRSLQIVGEVVLAALPEISAKADRR